MNFAFCSTPPWGERALLCVTLKFMFRPFYKTTSPFCGGFQITTTQCWVLSSIFTQSTCFQLALHCCVVHCFAWKVLFNICLLFMLISSLKQGNKHFIWHLPQSKWRYQDIKINIHRLYYLTVWPRSEGAGKCVAVFLHLASCYLCVHPLLEESGIKGILILYCSYISKP